MANNTYFTNWLWDYRVNLRQGEELRYYWVKSKFYDPLMIKENIAKMVSAQGLGGIRVYEIFGPTDVLVRVWIHPNHRATFRKWLEDALGDGSIEDEFDVTQIDCKQYPQGGRFLSAEHIDAKQAELLAMLDERSIKDVQAGRNKELTEQLVEAKLLFRRVAGGPDTIKFFIAIRLEMMKTKEILGDISKRIQTYLKGVESLHAVAIYRGFAHHCDLLVKGNVSCDCFFSVGAFMEWIRSEFRAFHTSTATYISALPTPLYDSNDGIGDATFLQNRGKKPLLFLIAPEAYEHPNGTLKDLENLFDDERDNFEKMEHRQLLHDCIVSLIKGKPRDMPTALYPFFADLEDLLRRSYPRVIKELGLQFSDLLSADKVSPGKHLPLGDLLKIVSRIIKTKGDESRQVLVGNWEELVEIRNSVMHGTPFKDWQSVLRTLMRQLPRVHQLECYLKRIAEEDVVAK